MTMTEKRGESISAKKRLLCRMKNRATITLDNLTTKKECRSVASSMLNDHLKLGLIKKTGGYVYGRYGRPIKVYAPSDDGVDYAKRRLGTLDEKSGEQAGLFGADAPKVDASTMTYEQIGRAIVAAITAMKTESSSIEAANRRVIENSLRATIRSKDADITRLKERNFTISKKLDDYEASQNEFRNNLLLLQKDHKKTLDDLAREKERGDALAEELNKIRNRMTKQKNSTVNIQELFKGITFEGTPLDKLVKKEVENDGR